MYNNHNNNNKINTRSTNSTFNVPYVSVSSRRNNNGIGLTLLNDKYI